MCNNIATREWTLWMVMYDLYSCAWLLFGFEGAELKSQISTRLSFIFFALFVLIYYFSTTTQFQMLVTFYFFCLDSLILFGHIMSVAMQSFSIE